MKSLKTSGIILKRMDMGEADRLLTLFTYDRGKVRAINKGARKTLSKLAGHLEPFSLTACQLQEGRNFYTITGAEIEQPFIGIRNQLNKTSLAYYFLDIVDAMTVDEEEQPGVFVLLQDSLVMLEAVDGNDDTKLVACTFTLKLLTELGYRPELDNCVHCHQALSPEDNRFSVKLGGIIGPECRGEDFDAPKLSANSIKAMRFIADQPIGLAVRLHVSGDALRELELIIETYLQFQTGRELRSTGFVREAAA